MRYSFLFLIIFLNLDTNALNDFIVKNKITNIKIASIIPKIDDEKNQFKQLGTEYNDRVLIKILSISTKPNTSNKEYTNFL